jgi:16S rRNA (adenine1518-N6/adenine1519-N6)-dimethyltransferase
VHVSEPDRLFAVIRASFQQRRKTILNALTGSPALSLTRAAADAALRAANIDPTRRGETLSLEEFARVAEQVGSRQ